MMAMFSFVLVLLLVALGEVVRGGRKNRETGRLDNFPATRDKTQEGHQGGRERVKEWKSEGERSSCHSLVFTQNAGVTTGSK